MGRRWGRVIVLAPLVAAALLPVRVAPARAAEYTLQSQATYDVRPAEREVRVAVTLTFTNTTPDPEGRFSVFEDLLVAIHDEATGVVAQDDDGRLSLDVGTEDDVNVATIELRDPLRYEDSVTVELTYTLPDGSSAGIRVRPSVVRFPAWSFGTSGDVSVTVPAGYEVRVDGDPLTEAGDQLTSGRIADPTAWLAQVTAVRPAEYSTFEATVPLRGGTADLVVRAFSDDEPWGERVRAVVTAALPLIEDAVGLPYPRVGQLILTESVTSDGTGFGEGADGGGTEILVAFDQPYFTAVHQVAHVWLSPELVGSRWLREGAASHVAALIGEEIGVEAPYDPAAVTEELADAAFPLDAWEPTSNADGESYGYAASWAFLAAIEGEVGADAIRTVLARAVASVGPYDGIDIEPDPDAEDGVVPDEPLTTRSFLDQLETVSGVALADRFAATVLTEADVALLEARAAARAAFDALVADADGWGAPDPVRAAMGAWSFEEADAAIAETDDWLRQRDALLGDLEDAGLQAPDRLQQAYRAYGGGPEAVAELEAEGVVVRDYVGVAEAVNAQRTFLERIGLVGGDDPQAQLGLANGRFADGDLRGATEAVREAERILEAAEGGGIVRLASLALVVLLLAAVAVVLFRRRASYTAAP